MFKHADPSWLRYILPKGYVALDGCSLTVGETGTDWFSVYLIPETLRVTVFGSRAVGDAVNVEVEAQTQAVVETVERVLGDYLRRAGLPPLETAAAAAAAAVGGRDGAAA